MARPLRVEYPGAVYHVLNRGDRREPIFKDDTDRQAFLATLGEACGKTGWQVHALCLLPNHFHLVVETPQANLVAGMKWLLGTYTGRFNRRHRLTGHLFAGRYKALIVDGSGSGYLKTVCDYVHLNPARAKLLRPEEPLRAFPWSTWPEYLQPPSRRPAWLRVDRLLGEWGIRRDTAAGRRQLEEGLERRRAAEEGKEYAAIRRGWCLGAEAFREGLLERLAGRVGAEPQGAARREAAAAQAERIIREVLGQRGSPAELRKRAKGDRQKVQLAARLRAETTVTVAWIAARLAMGTPNYLNNRLYR
jgi:REP element-mobilizing transposase RayT